MALYLLLVFGVCWHRRQKLLSFTNSPNFAGCRQKSSPKRKSVELEFTKDKHVSTLTTASGDGGRWKSFPGRGYSYRGAVRAKGGKLKQRRHYFAFVTSDICTSLARFDHMNFQWEKTKKSLSVSSTLTSSHLRQQALACHWHPGKSGSEVLLNSKKGEAVVVAIGKKGTVQWKRSI